MAMINIRVKASFYSRSLQFKFYHEETKFQFLVVQWLVNFRKNIIYSGGHCAMAPSFGPRWNYARNKQLPKNLVALGFMPEINTIASNFM